MLLTERPGLVELLETHATMRIHENVARKRLRMLFHNTRRDPQTEATFFLELEPGQKVEQFKVRVAGKEMEGEILDAEKSKAIYEEIVRKKKDPALLEMYGARLVRFRIFPIPPQAEFEVEVDTIEHLRAQQGVVRVDTINASTTSFGKPLRRVSVEATVTSAKTVKSIFSPTHAVNVERKDAREARLRYEKANYVTTGRFVFYYVLGEEGLGATLIAHAEAGEDGSFMLLLTPPAEVKEEDRLPRDVVFVADVSGSMGEQGKMEQARAALKKFIGTLTDRDRFNIVSFATEAAAWREAPVPATAEHREAASRHADGLRARGGTNVEEALKLALAQPFRGEATKIVLLLSDGAPTIGEREPLKLAAGASKPGVRVFTFGFGADVNTQLLDRLALETGGDRQYVHPKEDLALVLDAFAKRIDAPILAGPALDFGKEAGIAEIHPKRLPDIFRGGELVVFGRFKGEKPRRVELSGTAAGERVSRAYDLDFTPSPAHDFVARLWAIQKIDFLIDEMRARGTSKELVDHIVELAKKYAIVTPYTSFLITEDAATGFVEGQHKQSLANRFVGDREWMLSRNQQDWRNAGNNEAQVYAGNHALGRGNDARGVAQALNEQRLVSNRAFYNRQGNWVQTGYAAQNARSLTFAGDDYFKYLRENPEARAWMSLGQNVVFWNRGEWVRVEG